MQFDYITIVYHVVALHHLGIVRALAPHPRRFELVRQVLPLLKRRGRKVHLARILGVPRQRLQVCLKAKSACLDAERTLLLLAWLARQSQGKTLV